MRGSPLTDEGSGTRKAKGGVLATKAVEHTRQTAVSYSATVRPSGTLCNPIAAVTNFPCAATMGGGMLSEPGARIAPHAGGGASG